ncbi:MAG: UbiH/UbiF family hydroxylase [Paracoccaceae bacterium]|jgi:2-octaprenyl-6-methoxyphenol hydroxylase|nr:UbiH/UbiF family hydroxylase [Paracoccaceae bacterium]MDG2258295.1 UbiH/UbiF family hydroxylase [Paracoccaceae bacterium]
MTLSNSSKADILVSGGGIAGLTAAAAFGSKGFDVVCVDPTPPIIERDAAGADLRTTAFLQPSQALLANIGLWEVFAPYAAALKTMRIVDAGGTVAEPRLIKEFHANEISENPFGWNLPNWLLRRELLAFIKHLPNVDFRQGVGSKSLFTRTNEARVALTDGSQVRCKLVVAADGRNSLIREAAGIDVKTLRYGQKALAFAVTHPKPHENVSTEIHRSGGPFTLVPLPDYNGLNSSAIVWMETGAEVDRLANLPTEDFQSEMNTRSCELFGPLTLASRRTVWPIISQVAQRMTAERVALLAEAAHVVPPIGAQGLNMSLGDLRTLLDLADNDRNGLGSQHMLDTYHKCRHTEVQTRVKGIDLLNRASMAQKQALRDVRATGLNALYSLAPVRKTLMQMGLGVKG